jgi:hypothetical protein
MAQTPQAVCGPAHCYPSRPSKTERRDGSWRGSARAVAIESVTGRLSQAQSSIVDRTSVEPAMRYCPGTPPMRSKCYHRRCQLGQMGRPKSLWRQVRFAFVSPKGQCRRERGEDLPFQSLLKISDALQCCATKERMQAGSSIRRCGTMAVRACSGPMRAARRGGEGKTERERGYLRRFGEAA